MRLLVWAAILSAGPTAFAADGPTVEVPYRLTDTQHVLVRVKINGKGPFNFILDTGAPALILAKQIAEKAGLQPDDKGWATFEKIELEGGLQLPKNFKGLVLDMFQLKGMNSLGLAGVELHGVLGYTVLARYRIQYDFTLDKLQWTPLDFEPPAIIGLGEKAKEGQGSLEAMGDMAKMFGPLLGLKANFAVKPRGFLGIEVAEKEDAVVVTKLQKDGPAATAGVAVNDIIQRVTIGKTRSDIDQPKDLFKAVAETVPGDEIVVRVKRGDDKKDITIKLGEGF